MDLTAREHERALRIELSALESAFELHVGVYDELREEVQTRIDESWERVAADQGAGASTAVSLFLFFSVFSFLLFSFLFFSFLFFW